MTPSGSRRGNLLCSDDFAGGLSRRTELEDPGWWRSAPACAGPPGT